MLRGTEPGSPEEPRGMKLDEAVEVDAEQDPLFARVIPDRCLCTLLL